VDTYASYAVTATNNLPI